jgi:general stress protein YciG
MEEDQVSKYLSQIGRKGGQSRAKRLSPEQRKEIARKAGKASGKVRKRKAKQKQQ